MTSVETSQSAAAYEAIREWIVVGDLAPGTLVSERGLMADTGCGKTPVREALARLVSDGFVTAQPRRGYVVTALTIADVDELLELWRVLGPATARLAFERNRAKVLRVLRTSIRAMRTDIEAGRQFFEALAEATGNRRLVEANARLFNDLYRFLFLAYRAQPRKDWLVVDLRDIEAALRSGDPDAAVAAYLRSIEHGAAELHAVLSALPSVRATPLSA